MSSKFTFEYVKQYFKDRECELLVDKYINCFIKMPYICKCGNKAEINFHDFKNGRRCKNCGIKKRSASARLSFEYVKQFFKDEGCILLANEYINSQTKMPYICKCGNKAEITFGHFQQGKRCVECGGSKKLTIEYVKQYFKDEGCTLLATEYVNSKTKMPYICSCGNKSEIFLDNFRKGKRCSKCGNNEKLTLEKVKIEFIKRNCVCLATEYVNAHTKMPFICRCGNVGLITYTLFFDRGLLCGKCSKNKKHAYDFVKAFFEKEGCTLLATEYVNSKTKMPYICSCGNKSEIIFSSFQQGKRCQDCKYKKHIFTRKINTEQWKNSDINFLSKQLEATKDENAS